MEVTPTMSVSEALDSCRALLRAPGILGLDRDIDREARARACAAILAEVAR